MPVTDMLQKGVGGKGVVDAAAQLAGHFIHPFAAVKQIVGAKVDPGTQQSVTVIAAVVNNDTRRISKGAQLMSVRRLKRKGER
ncbi:MAG: hypothetical protein R3E79_12570 [Caldilineaceae bacterium]